MLSNRSPWILFRCFSFNKWQSLERHSPWPDWWLWYASEAWQNIQWLPHHGRLLLDKPALYITTMVTMVTTFKPNPPWFTANGQISSIKTIHVIHVIYVITNKYISYKLLSHGIKEHINIIQKNMFQRHLKIYKRKWLFKTGSLHRRCFNMRADRGRIRDTYLRKCPWIKGCPPIEVSLEDRFRHYHHIMTYWLHFKVWCLYLLLTHSGQYLIYSVLTIC